MKELSVKADIESLVVRQKNLLSRAAKAREVKAAISAELEARRRNLRKNMEAAQKAGYDPENMASELARKVDVERTKLAVFEDELATAENIMRPMLEEIRKA